MPEPKHPPFVPEAMLQPRQLYRWLDINPQGGQLTRTQKYVTLPAFTQNVTWKGYSEIVIAFNFEGPNNFSFTSLTSEIPLNPNYLLAVSWYDSLGNHHRYSLWSNIGEVLYFTMDTYEGQLIKKNFRLEVWSTDVATVSNTTAINIYSSVLSNIDYRYGSDSSLKDADAEVTNFQNINTIGNLPAEIGAQLRWQPSGIIDNGSNRLVTWTDNIHGAIMNPSGIIGVTPAIGIPKTVNQVYIQNGAFDIECLAGPLLLTLSYTVLIVKFTDAMSGAVFYLDNGGTTANYDSGTEVLNLNAGFGNIPINDINEQQWYTIILSQGVILVYDLLTGEHIGNNAGSSSITTAGKIIVAACTVLDMTMGTGSLSNPQAVADYFTGIYSNAYTLPLTFPSNAVSVTN